jgi:glycosyltransferase involved in cell wall biosynthesis
VIRRLTLFIDSLAPGGAQKQMVALAAGLDPERWQVRLAWYNQTARFHTVPAHVQALPLPRKTRTDLRFLPALAGLVSRRQTDLVHAWLPAPALYATVAARLPRSAPVIVAVRCSPSLFANDPTQGHMTLAGARLAQAVTSNSRASLDWLADRGIPRHKLHFVGNILAPAIADRQPSTVAQRRALLASLGLDPDRPPIVSLGRFDAYKNQDGLLRALLQVRDAGMAVPPLLLAGFLEDTARVESVRKLARDAGFADLHIVPAVQDVPTLLEAARFSVLASRSEGTPNVVLEGLGLGTLVVATRVGEVPDLIRHDHTGILCQPDDDRSLAQALREALEMPAEVAKELGRAARADMLQRFSAPAVIGQYEGVYLSLEGRRNGQAP